MIWKPTTIRRTANYSGATNRSWRGCSLGVTFFFNNRITFFINLAFHFTLMFMCANVHIVDIIWKGLNWNFLIKFSVISISFQKKIKNKIWKIKSELGLFLWGQRYANCMGRSCYYWLKLFASMCGFSHPPTSNFNALKNLKTSNRQLWFRSNNCLFRFLNWFSQTYVCNLFV